MSGARRVTALAAAAAVVLLLSACASIPTSGGVKQATVQDQGIAGNVTFQQAPPVPGASADDIVNGFLLAATGPQKDYRVARSFLTPAFAPKWKPTTRVLVSSGALQHTDPTDETVTVTVPTVATLDADGVYTALRTTAARPLKFTIEKVGGQRRISAAPDGIVLSQNDFQNLFLPRPLDFFDPSWRNLVPDLRWFSRDQSTKSIVARLLGGPRGILTSPVAVSAFPAATRVTAVTPAGGGVTVALDTPGNPSTVQIERMQQQLSASLPSASSVGLVVNGSRRAALDSSTGPPRLDPRPVVVKGGAFGYLNPGGRVSASVLAKSVLAAKPTAIMQASTLGIAAVLASGDAELVTGAARTVVDRRPDQIAPSVDPDGWVWSATGDDPNTIRVTNAKRVTQTVQSALPTGELRAMEVSPDGTRLLVLQATDTSARAAVYGIQRTANGEPDALTPTSVSIAVFGTHPLDATWADTGTVATLGRGTGTDGDEVITQAVGGVESALPKLTGTRAIAGGATSGDLVVQLQNGQLLTEPQGIWTPIGEGASVLAVQR